MVAVFQPSLHMSNIVQRESMLKVHVEIIFVPNDNITICSTLFRWKLRFKICQIAHLLYWIKFLAFINYQQYRPGPEAYASATADKGWAVKRARLSKKVWCSGLGLCLEMSPVFDFGQGLRCGLSFRHCRCHWIMAAWELSCFLTLFVLVPLCWYAVCKRQMLLIFCGRFSWSKQTSLSNGFSGYFHDSTTELYFRYITPMSMLFQNKNN